MDQMVAGFWEQYGATIIVALVTGVLSLIGGVLRGKSKTLDKVIDAVSQAGVNHAEVTVAQPYKDNNNVQKLPPVAQTEAKDTAFDHVVTALSPFLGGAAPVIEKYGPKIMDAIEAGVQRSKQTLPSKTASGFKKVLILAGTLAFPWLACALALPLSGCAGIGLPYGWDVADDQNVDAVAGQVYASIYSERSDMSDAVVVALRDTGDAGAVAARGAAKLYNKPVDELSDGDMDKVLQAGAIAARNWYEGMNGELAGRVTLGSAIRMVCDVPDSVSDAECVLGLIRAALRASKKERLDLPALGDLFGDGSHGGSELAETLALPTADFWDLDR